MRSVKKFNFLTMLTLFFLAACAIDHPGDDPGRDECSREDGSRVTPNCPRSEPR